MTELDKDKRIAQLEQLLGLQNSQNINTPKKFTFSQIDIKKLRELVDIERNFSGNIFNNWLNNNIFLDKDIELFLKELLDREASILKYYNEEDLKMYFLSQIFYKINFKNMKYKVRYFSEETLTYEHKNFILSGNPDFIIARGLDIPQKPYFFIQEFKQDKKSSDPEYQLVAELISAVEINNWKIIKGCYIKGVIWRFMILEKLGVDKYQYFVSEDFNSTKIEELKEIYKNLLFIKNEVIEMIKRGD